jgi:glyoxylase-like metal-dependent hydrolase (beta-lactamase superfamily II)
VADHGVNGYGVPESSDLANWEKEEFAQMEKSQLAIHTVVSMPFDENTYIVSRPGEAGCLVIDPGFDPQQIFDVLAEHDLTPVAILCTHGHSDHIAGNAALKERWPAIPLIIGHGDASKLTDPVGNLSAGYGFKLVSPPADQTVKEGEELTLAGITLKVRETPGHSAGHVVFIVEDHEPTLVLGGDVLFAGGIGRTDFADGSFPDLKRSIQEKLFALPDDTIVLSGHGPATTIGREKESNPYVGKGADYEG